ncbi:MAG: hypothetical protein ACK5XV_05470 [Flavobacteriales bacterium]
MRIRPILSILAVLALAAVTSCKRSDDYVPQPYVCDCGNLKWRGSTFELLDANHILLDSTEAFSRRYYITADIQAEGEELTHTLSMNLDSEDVGFGLLNLDDEDAEFSARVYERNDNDIFQPYREYQAIEGVVQVVPAIFGGSEPVQFSLVLREVDEDGSLFGPEINFTGRFKVLVVL